MKEKIKSVVVLTAICLVVAVLLAVTNYYTAPIIAQNKEAASLGSLAIVMPEATGFEEVTAEFTDLPATVKNVYKESSGLGYVMVLATTSQFSSGDMGITVGFGADGKICGVELTSYFESKDFGPDYPVSFVGQDSALGGVTLVAGATYSSVAFRDAVTDAFNVLINNGLVAEGQKSEEQLIAEAMPLALPGCTDALGNCLVTEIEAVAPATQAYKANNACGYIYVVSGDNGTVVVGVNAFGVAKVIDLEGNDVTADSADLAATAAAFNTALATETLEADLTSVTAAVEEGAVITPIEGLNTFSNVTAAFTAETSTGVQYVVLTQVYGFGNHGIKMLHVFDENGTVVAYKSVGAIVLEADYFQGNPLTDEGAYKEQFVGVSESTWSDEAALVAGATVTSNAVTSSFHSAFEAFNLIKEVAAQ